MKILGGWDGLRLDGQGMSLRACADAHKGQRDDRCQHGVTARVHGYNIRGALIRYGATQLAGLEARKWAGCCANKHMRLAMSTLRQVYVGRRGGYESATAMYDQTSPGHRAARKNEQTTRTRGSVWRNEY